MELVDYRRFKIPLVDLMLALLKPQLSSRQIDF